MSTFFLVLFLWIFSVCLHEFAHAAVAYRGGDVTVKDKGYLSMNPLKYLDPMGSIILPVVFLIMGGIGLPGAAVYIDRRLLRSAHWDSAVSLAGPAMNIVLLLLLSLLLSLPAVRGSDYAPALPLPGFDGYGALWPYLPRDIRALFDRYANYAMLALFLLLFLVPPVARAFWGLVALLTHAAGIPLGLAQVGYGEFKFWD